MSDLTPQQRRRRDELIALALLGADEVPEARELWRAHTPRTFHGMLDGEGFTFDPAAQVYHAASGRAVKDADLKRLALLFVLGTEEELRRDAVTMLRSRSNVTEWALKAGRTIRAEYTAAGALGVGGFARLTTADYAAIMGSPDVPPGLAYSLARLAVFADAIESAEAGTDAEVLSRVGMYGAVGNTVYEELRRNSHLRARDDKGRLLYLYELNVLDDDAEHCEDDPRQGTAGCPELTALGWVEIGTLPPPGARTCFVNCKCHLRFNLIGPAENN